MRRLPVLLLVLSLPAGIVGYAIAAQVIASVLGGQAVGIVGLFVPLLVAGLCMVPFLVPFVDQKAKQDLAAHRAELARSDAEGGSSNGDRPASPDPSTRYDD